MRSLLCALSLGAVCILLTGCKDRSGGINVTNYPTFPTTTDEPVTLRYKLKAGQKMTMSVDMDLNMDIKQGRQTLKMKMPMVMEAKADVTATDVDGNMSLNLNITRMKVTADISGEKSAKTEFDSNQQGGSREFAPLRAMINVSMPCKITPTGKLLECDTAPLMRALDGAGNVALAKQMKDTLNQMVEETFAQLSEKPVKAGETYPGGTMELNGAKATVAYKVRSVSGDKTQAVLEPVAQFDFNGAAFPGAEVKVKNQAFGGWLLFDLQNGYVSKSEVQISMDIDIKAGGETGTMTMKAKMVMTATVR
jgi:hypothetical protein